MKDYFNKENFKKLKRVEKLLLLSSMLLITTGLVLLLLEIFKVISVFSFDLPLVIAGIGILCAGIFFYNKDKIEGILFIVLACIDFIYVILSLIFNW